MLWFAATVWKHFTGCHLAAAVLGTPVLAVLTPGPAPAPPHPHTTHHPPTPVYLPDQHLLAVGHHEWLRWPQQLRVSAWTGSSQTLRKFRCVLQGTLGVSHFWRGFLSSRESAIITLNVQPASRQAQQTAIYVKKGAVTQRNIWETLWVWAAKYEWALWGAGNSFQGPY